jgi:hypothetical protein
MTDRRTHGEAQGIAALIETLRDEIAQHCASFFWNDVNVGLLHARWRDKLAALTAALVSPPETIARLTARETGSPGRHGYTLAIAQLEDSRDQWKARAEELHVAWESAKSELNEALADVGVSETQRLADALLELSDLRQAHAWQPIETAPKDGTPVLLFGKFTSLSGAEGGYIGQWFQGYSDRGWWVVSALPFFPTHWMPLPEPPR